MKRELIYVQFQKDKQAEFLRLVKSNLSLTWINLAGLLKISKRMMYLYLAEDSRIPHSSFIKLCKMANIDPNNFEYYKFNIILKGIGKIPEITTPELAEFIGILLGDGSITLSNYRICIILHSILDEQYLNTIVRKYFILLFGKEPCICYSKRANCVTCFIYSKDVCNFLMILGLPNGKRTYRDDNVIPVTFFNDDNVLKNVIRGLFDTEGGIYQHNKTSPRVYIYNKSEALLNSIHLALIKLDYKAIKKKRCVKICRKEDIARFFNEIGTNNPYKQLKYQIWLKEGKVPSTARILDKLSDCDPMAKIRASHD